MSLLNKGIPFFFVLLSGVFLGFSVNEWQAYSFSFSFTVWFAFVPLFLVLKDVESFWVHVFYVYIVSAIYISFALGSFLISSATAGVLVILFGSVLFSFPLITVFWVKHRIGFNRSLLFLAFFWPLYDLWFIEKLIEMPIFTVSICQSAYPKLIQYIDITGYGGIATWIITLNLTIYIWLSSLYQQTSFSNWFARHRSEFVKLTGIVLLHFILPFLYFAVVKSWLTPDLYKKIKVVSVQQAYPDDKTFTDSSWVSVLYNYVEKTDLAIQQTKPDLIVWPENAIGTNFKGNPDLQKLLLTNVLSWETTLLSGTFDLEYVKENEMVPPLLTYLNRNYHVYNGAILLTPQFAWKVIQEGLSVDLLNIYRKEHAMPFAEKVPLSETFPVLSNLGVKVGGLIHLTPGKNEGLLRFLAKGKHIVSVQPLICWDILFSHPESIKKSNPDFIAGLANESHFGKVFSTMPNGIVGYSRMRSIEYRRSIVKTSPQGFTFTMNPFGEITYRIPWLTNDVLLSEVELNHSKTLYMYYPYLYSGVCTLICLLILKSKKTKDIQ